MNILINGETGAKTVYPDFSSFEGNEQLAISATGLNGSEAIVLQFSVNGTAWEDLYQYGVRITLTATNNSVGLYAPARIRLVKPTTVNPVYLGIGTKDTNVHTS